MALEAGSSSSDCCFSPEVFGVAVTSSCATKDGSVRLRVDSVDGTPILPLKVRTVRLPSELGGEVRTNVMHASVLSVPIGVDGVQSPGAGAGGAVVVVVGGTAVVVVVAGTAVVVVVAPGTGVQVVQGDDGVGSARGVVGPPAEDTRR